MGWQASGPSLGRSPGFQLRLVQNRLSTDLIDELVAAFQAGATHSELAARFNIARTTVIAHLKRAGIRRPRNGIPADRIDEVASLYRDGHSLAQLGNPRQPQDGLERPSQSRRPNPAQAGVAVSVGLGELVHHRLTALVQATVLL